VTPPPQWRPVECQKNTKPLAYTLQHLKQPNITFACFTLKFAGILGLPKKIEWPIVEFRLYQSEIACHG
jgi:hypothetical protein